MQESRHEAILENQGPPRIWAVTEYYHPNFSGAAIQSHRILSRLAARGSDVCVWTAADQAARQLAAAPLQLDGVRIEYLPVIRRRTWDCLAAWPCGQRAAVSLNRLLRGLSFHVRLAWRLLRRGRRYDVLQFYIVDDFTWLVIAAARLRGVQTVIQISLLGADDPLSFRPSLLGLSTAIKRSCFHRVDRVIGLSQALTRSCELAGIDPHRVVRIPNGVDLQQFAPAGTDQAAIRRHLGLDPQRRYLVFVGSAIHRKGIDVLIAAFIAGAGPTPDVELLIVGPCDFSDRTRHAPARQHLVEQLRDRLRRHGLAERVHWIGQVENVQQYLQAADLFFFPTRREGLPNALAEAMACGLPVLASCLDGITTDLVRDGREGRLIAGHEPADYARALRELLGDSALLAQMGRSARRRIEDQFALDGIVERYAVLYRELAEQKNRRKIE